MATVLHSIERRVTPSSRERAQIDYLADAIMKSARIACDTIGLRAEVRLDGSVAKNTWVAGEADLDIFLRVSPTLSRDELERLGLKAGRLTLRQFTSDILERFSEHPYLEGYVKGIRVNVVPCYDVEKGRWQSATDRSPFHTEYIRAHLNEEGRRGVRFLKRFMKGIGVYGSDVKVGGFSGMLCETIIAHYGSFERAVADSASWKSGKAIDVEQYYKERESEIQDLFPEPLVVIDPVDEGRNLAASVTADRLWEFVSASRAFLETPRHHFFYPKPRIRGLRRRVARGLQNRGHRIVAISFGKIDAVVDIAWGQLYRTERALLGELRQNGFTVARSSSWTDESTTSVILFEVETSTLPSIKIHRGPDVSRRQESLRFLQKHTRTKDTVAGPWIAQGRWIVIKKPPHKQAEAVLKRILRSGGEQVGVGRKVAKAMRGRFKISHGRDFLKRTRPSAELLLFLDDFLRGTPHWLRPRRAK